MKSLLHLFSLCVVLCTPTLNQAQSNQASVARKWNEALIQSIREDFARPPVHARNLYHTSLAMYDAWAVYDSVAKPILLGNQLGTYFCPFNGIAIPADREAAQKEAMSYAVMRVMIQRFQFSPNAGAAIQRFYNLMFELGYDPFYSNADYSDNNPASLGNYIGNSVVQMGLEDGSNEQFQYYTPSYFPLNQPLEPELPGNPNLVYINNWQPLKLTNAIDQNGNPIPATQAFQSPGWGYVLPFAMGADDITQYTRATYTLNVYHDPGVQPKLDTSAITEVSEFFKWNMELVSIWGSHLNTNDGVMWDISPASLGNLQGYPSTIEEYKQFYDLENGGDHSTGRSINPKTGQPYPPQMVPRGDYTRVLAEFWADGPNSETPPGHWFAIFNKTMDNPLFQRRFNGKGPELSPLEWDVKAYLALGAALHDAAVSAWSIKGWYDAVRPISAIRYMASKGQSSDPSLPNYHPGGLQLRPGFIEMVQAGDTLAGPNNEHVGKVKLFTWRGPHLVNPNNPISGVGWVLAENWWTFQVKTFVTPPFGGYISGHSTYSSAAAETLTLLTGDPYFPGGVGEFTVNANTLKAEQGPTVPVTLQWATYRDASDQTSLSRIWGGIHPPFDDIPGRKIGKIVGEDAFALARTYFYTDTDQDGFFSYEDCNDNNANIHPNAIDICDGIDNNCNGLLDEAVTFSYFLDTDGDGYGSAALPSLDTCVTFPPAGYSTNNLDCNDSDPGVNPFAVDFCDGVDNNCNGILDEAFVFSYYVDLDGDGFGDATAQPYDTCSLFPPSGYAANNLDCDDLNDALNPNKPEICDGLDNDCNGLVDDGLVLFVFYSDQDGDGYGDNAVTDTLCSDTAPTGYTTIGGDCNDQNPLMYPGLLEVLDGLDNDCNGEVDDVVSSNEASLSPTLLVFPNPTKDLVYIHASRPGNAVVRVSTTAGQLVQTLAVNFQSGYVTLPLTNLPAGNYWLQGQYEDGSWLRPVLVGKL